MLAHQRRKLGDPWPEMTEYSRDCWHCISPPFLKDQLSASLGRLAMPRVDLLLLHNPEYFLADAEHRNLPLAEARDAFYDRMGRAFEQLEKEIAELEAEKKAIEDALCSGTLSVDELTEKSRRLPQLTDLIDEKTMRWLELSEME